MTTDLSTPEEPTGSGQLRRFPLPREGAVVTGSLVSGGALGWALSLVAANLPPRWKEIVTPLVPAATSAISGLVYGASRLARKHWGPKRFQADREAVIRKCDERLRELHQARAEVQRSRPSHAKAENLKKVGQAIEGMERKKLLAQVAEYPDRLWEDPRETALAIRKKKSGTGD